MLGSGRASTNYEHREGQMEELLQQIREACAGKDVAQIADEIRASAHGDAVDADLLAEYFASLATE